MPVTTYPLHAFPTLRIAQAPELSSRAAQVAQQQRAIIEADAHEYDGAMLMCLNADGRGITAYETTFSVVRAHDILGGGGPSELGCGAVGASLMLFDPAGRALFSQRSAHVRQPHRWGVSANGGVDPGEHPRDAALREAYEELRLEPEQLHDLHGHAVLSGGHIGSVFVFSALVDHDIALTPDPHEVQATRWFEHLPTDPITTHTADIYYAAVNGRYPPNALAA